MTDSLTAIDLWENELSDTGPFGGNDKLIDLYKRAPDGAPSLSILKSWLVTNGVDLKGI